MTQIGRMAGSILTASAFNQLGQYTSSPGRKPTWNVGSQKLISSILSDVETFAEFNSTIIFF